MTDFMRKAHDTVYGFSVPEGDTREHIISAIKETVRVLKTFDGVLHTRQHDPFALAAQKMFDASYISCNLDNYDLSLDTEIHMPMSDGHMNITVSIFAEFDTERVTCVWMHALFKQDNINQMTLSRYLGSDEETVVAIHKLIRTFELYDMGTTLDDDWYRILDELFDGSANK